jgi:hypothetical protein
MKQQVLEARIARIEAIAKQAIKDGGHAAALVEIIKIAGRDAS